MDKDFEKKLIKKQCMQGLERVRDSVIRKKNEEIEEAKDKIERKFMREIDHLNDLIKIREAEIIKDRIEKDIKPKPSEEPEVPC